MKTMNDAVVVRVGRQGALELVRTLGDFSGDAVHGVVRDLERGGGDLPPLSAWYVPVLEDYGDPDVGLPPLGWVLDWDAARPYASRLELEEYDGPEPMPEPVPQDITAQVLAELLGM